MQHSIACGVGAHSIALAGCYSCKLCGDVWVHGLHEDMVAAAFGRAFVGASVEEQKRDVPSPSNFSFG